MVARAPIGIGVGKDVVVEVDDEIGQE